jgi:Arc/MetJ-type ribon-helix-helix transcriptional regulator
MEVHLTPDQEAFLRQAIASGRFQREEEALQEAFALWEARERNRREILAALDEAESGLETGQFADYTDAALPRLAEELKHEARTSRDGRSHR